jgi:hypothetical protein
VCVRREGICGYCKDSYRWGGGIVNRLWIGRTVLGGGVVMESLKYGPEQARIVESDSQGGIGRFDGSLRENYRNDVQFVIFLSFIWSSCESAELARDTE